MHARFWSSSAIGASHERLNLWCNHFRFLCLGLHTFAKRIPRTVATASNLPPLARDSSGSDAPDPFLQPELKCLPSEDIQEANIKKFMQDLMGIIESENSDACMYATENFEFHPQGRKAKTYDLMSRSC